MYTIDIANEQDLLPVDEPRVRRVVERILADAGWAEAELSLAIVDDAAIRDLHREFLEIDEPTDVLSFLLEVEKTRSGGQRLAGEVVASAETARRVAGEWGWPGEDELLLYLIHGALHLVGYDDLSEAPRAEMRRRERDYLAMCGLTPPVESAAAAAPKRRPTL